MDIEYIQDVMKSGQNVDHCDIKELIESLSTAEQERDQYKANQVFDASRKKLLEDAGFSDVVELLAGYDSIRAQLNTANDELEQLREQRNRDKILADRDHWMRRAEKAEAELKAKNAALEAIAFATSPNYDDGSYHENAYVLSTEAIATPIPAQQSPAVAVPMKTEAISQELSHARVYLYSYVESLERLASAQSPRITEQDARDIVEEIARNVPEDKRDNPMAFANSFALFLIEEAKKLLNKLNGTKNE